jgi:hypothetical protein
VLRPENVSQRSHALGIGVSPSLSTKSVANAESLAVTFDDDVQPEATVGYLTVDDGMS